MHRNSRSSSFTSIALGLVAMLGGCAHEFALTSDSQGVSAGLAAIGEHADINTPRSPAAVCDQYLALLSEERLQGARPRYGTEGECWSGDASQHRQCESECRSNIYTLIKGSLAQMEAEKLQRENTVSASE
ncbi:MAG TPA: hypothetical protein PLW65_24180 [Pseudomonadota bacterium]|nr:hypothetical protein [Pseudomonadota bacterium]